MLSKSVCGAAKVMRQTGCRLFGLPRAKAFGYRGTGWLNRARPGLWGERRATAAPIRKPTRMTAFRFQSKVCGGSANDQRYPMNQYAYR